MQASEKVLQWKSLANYASTLINLKTHIKVPPALILAVIHTESSGDHKAVSKHGAEGLMQLLPKTTEWLGVKDPFDPKQNVIGGTFYFAKLMTVFGGRIDLTLAAYNAGPGAVKAAGNQIPEREETKAYVPKVKALADVYKDA